MEIVNYATYDSPTVMFDVMVGSRWTRSLMLLQPGVLSIGWGSVVRQPRRRPGFGAGRPGGDVREPAPESFDIASGHIAEGTAAALRFEVIGWSTAPRPSCSSITRLRDDPCPQWPQPVQAGGNYRVEITGDPCYALDLCHRAPTATTITRGTGDRHAGG